MLSLICGIDSTEAEFDCLDYEVCSAVFLPGSSVEELGNGGVIDVEWLFGKGRFHAVAL